MGRGTDVSAEEQAVILAMSKENCGVREISRKVRRSVSAVAAVVKRGKVRRVTQRRGGPRKISRLLHRLLIRHGRTGRHTARTLRDSYAPAVSVRRVQQILSAAPDLRWARMERAPALLPRHKLARHNWARKHLSRGASFWKRTIFSDEKRWSLDGPDGLGYYWKDNTRGGRWLPQRQRGGGSIMVWAGFCAYGKLSLEFVSGFVNAESYQDILERRLLPFLEDGGVQNAIFQQDNAPSHTAVSTKEWFNSHKIGVLDWPARSADMNPIENVWGALSREVYRDGRQFDDLEELKEAIFYAWENIDMKYLKKLSAGMPKRLIECIEKKGAVTSYA